MELVMLLEEKDSLKYKITKTLRDLKEWFINKIEMISDFFRKLKDKITISQRKFMNGRDSITRDGKVDGEIIFKKGTKASSVISTIKSHLNLVKRDSEESIRQCKDGIRSIEKRDNEKAIDNKNKVLSKIKSVNRTTKIIITGIGVVATVGVVYNKKGKVKDGEDSYTIISNDNNSTIRVKDTPNRKKEELKAKEREKSANQHAKEMAKRREEIANKPKETEEERMERDALEIKKAYQAEQRLANSNRAKKEREKSQAEIEKLKVQLRKDKTELANKYGKDSDEYLDGAEDLNIEYGTLIHQVSSKFSKFLSTLD